ncbi:RNA polymerase factor sigma-54 [Parasphingopyxis algicola]|uniref:RNA polymerase factor sigma-54 n=1 Tax=Parasphingopyxis algicola TaxID=2026624 RepID=UPI0015A2C924|nr:RNA polymerase factor sigma-54 [Parasphingopyxis algicola]QLC25317.1 RNA polymerase factor sigma-54 [Parasphingopyxis algicola]
MALGPRLDLRQSQSLVMTPQLQQAIKLLALSNLEIEGFIAEELEKNPLLDAAGDEQRETAAPSEEGDGFEDAPDLATADTLVQNGGADDEARLDIEESALSDDSGSDAGMDGALGMTGIEGRGGGEDGPDLDLLAAADISLHDHLLAQAGGTLSGQDYLVAGQLIERIDETGYLRADLLRLSHQLGVPVADLERALGVIQTFEPTGVGARDLAECLAIQSREADRYDPAMARLIDNLDLLARGELGRLKRMCRVDDEDMADMIAELRDYDPKPGCQFGGEPVQAVVPDIFVAPGKKGWAVELNNATLPKLIVNRSYYHEMSEAGDDEESRAWLNECLANANWLTRALDQRARTIVKVAGELVKRQADFFRKGVTHLKPLTLREIAEAIDMHESTVSRATSNKYLSCDRGIFELKYFFTSGISTGVDGEAASSEAVKSHIRTLIENEDKILSDDKLVALLKDKGFDIARRTVAKYREAMGIGSSVERRRQKKLGNRAA